MKVKICGVTTLDDARMATDAGADLLGFNFYKASPRYLEPERALGICDALREEYGADCPTLVGVFVNETLGEISIITNQVGLDFAQLSGDETVNVLIELRGIGFKAIRPMNLDMALDDVQYFSQTFPEDERVPSLILDAYHPKLYGGTGEEANVEVAVAVRDRVPRLMLAGGLTPENVTERARQIKPWGLDVASGVEGGHPGLKVQSRVQAFIEAAKRIS